MYTRMYVIILYFVWWGWTLGLRPDDNIRRGACGSCRGHFKQNLTMWWRMHWPGSVNIFRGPGTDINVMFKATNTGIVWSSRFNYFRCTVNVKRFKDIQWIFLTGHFFPSPSLSSSDFGAPYIGSRMPGPSWPMVKSGHGTGSKLSPNEDEKESWKLT